MSKYDPSASFDPSASLKRVIMYFVGGFFGFFGILTFVDINDTEGFCFLREFVLVMGAFAFGIGGRDAIIRRPYLILLVPVGLLLLAFLGF
jgi:hypothetical protein